MKMFSLILSKVFLLTNLTITDIFGFVHQLWHTANGHIRVAQAKDLVFF